ncbi:MAG: glycosyltransferase [Candidatus Binatia bacterium]
MASDPILLAIDGLAVGGTERQVVELLRGLHRSGRHRVALSVLDRGGALEPEALALAARVLPVRRRARFDVTPAAALLRQARQARIGLVLAIGRLSGLAGLWVARRLGVPIVNASIRSAPASLAWRDRLSRWCAARSDAIVANARAGLRAHGLAAHPRAQVIANAIDLARFADVVAADAGPADICMVANFNPRKDHATPVRALPLVRRTIPEARLVLVGGDAGTLADTRRLARELGVAAAVRVVCDTARPESIVAASRVCVLSSPSEACSNAILEYMALARPIVASDTCGDSADLIAEANCGCVVPFGAVEPLAATLVTLLRDPTRARAMGEAGRRRVADFTVARMAAAYEAVFDRLLRRGRP